MTDNNALRWLQSRKDIGGKFARWILALQEFDLEIRYIKGVDNAVADALSRYPTGPTEETDPTENTIFALKRPYFQCTA